MERLHSGISASRGNCVQPASSDELWDFCCFKKQNKTKKQQQQQNIATVKYTQGKLLKSRYLDIFRFSTMQFKNEHKQKQHNFPPYCRESNLSTTAFNWTHVLGDGAFGLNRRSSFSPTQRDGKMVQREKECKNRD